jgi:hypothetical protein
VSSLDGLNTCLADVFIGGDIRLTNFEMDDSPALGFEWRMASLFS